MSRIRVLHVIARMNVGGTARYVGDLVKDIPNSALATGQVQGAEVEDPVLKDLDFYRISHLGRRISPKNDFKAWLELRRLIKELNPEIVHTHTFKAGLLGRLVRGNHKRVHTFHGHLFDDQTFSHLQKVLIIFAERFLANRTDTLISVGERVGKELRESGIGSNGKWASIAPGINPLPMLNVAQARQSLGLKQGELIVGWMARMTGVKNPRLFLALAKKRPALSFAMAGGGDLLDEIERLAPSNVKVLGWTDAASFWSSIDLAVSTSDNEGMPIALIEAQMAGVPIIATNAGSTGEVIQSGITGLLAEKNEESLLRALDELTADRQLLESMSQSAKILALKNFTRECMVQAHLDIYEALDKIA